MQGNIWVYIPAGRTLPDTLPDVPLLAGFDGAAPQIATTMRFPSNADIAAYGFCDPAHPAFVHTSRWWKSQEVPPPAPKSKTFEPIEHGFRMKPHTLTGNAARPYRLLGTDVRVDVSLRLPGMRIEHIRGERHAACVLATVTPVTELLTDVHYCVYWTVPWLAPLRPIAAWMARDFLRQDLDMAAKLAHGAVTPPMLFVGDADTQIAWLMRLKREYLASQAEGRPSLTRSQSRHSNGKADTPGTDPIWLPLRHGVEDGFDGQLGARSVLGVRRHTERLCEHLSAEDQCIQSMPDASPAKWHRAHTTWFFEQFVLLPNMPATSRSAGDFSYLFNSYYEAVGARHPRFARGMITRPDARRSRLSGPRRRCHGRADCQRQDLASAGHARPAPRAAASGTADDRLAACVQPESALPGDDPRLASPGSLVTAEAGFVACDGGTAEIGHAAAGFSFDNEGPRTTRCYRRSVAYEPGAQRRLARVHGRWRLHHPDALDV